MSMPITNQSLQLHQVVLATSLHYGIHIGFKVHHESGGSLHGVLNEDEDETVAEKFNCIPANPATDSLIATEEAKKPSDRCDGDHKFGRDTRYLNGIFFVQGVSHRENIIRHYIRKTVREWLYPLLIGVYKDGNTKPEKPVRRL